MGAIEPPSAARRMTANRPPPETCAPPGRVVPPTGITRAGGSSGYAPGAGSPSHARASARSGRSRGRPRGSSAGRPDCRSGRRSRPGAPGPRRWRGARRRARRSRGAPRRGRGGRTPRGRRPAAHGRAAGDGVLGGGERLLGAALGEAERRERAEDTGMLEGHHTRGFEVTEIEVTTPIEETTTKVLAGKKVAVIPILRAGLGMVDGILELIPAAQGRPRRPVPRPRDAQAGRVLLQAARGHRRARRAHRRPDARDGRLGRGGGRVPARARARAASSCSCSSPRPRASRRSSSDCDDVHIYTCAIDEPPQRPRLHRARSRRRRRPPLRHQVAHAQTGASACRARPGTSTS